MGLPPTTAQPPIACSFDLPRPIAFVLSGGASSGALHVGMLNALSEAAIRPDMVIGTSVGAINGSQVAHDPETAADQLFDIWHAIDRQDVFPRPTIKHLSRLIRHRRHLFCPSRLTKLIRDNQPVDLVEDLSVPFGAVATCFRTGRAVTLRAGCLERALLASAAIPGIFPRVDIDGSHYIDGGVAANVPIRPALAAGAASLIVLDATTPSRPEAPRNIAHAFVHVAGLVLRRQFERDLDALPPSVPLVHIDAGWDRPTSPFDFSQTSAMIDAGYEAARLALRACGQPPAAGVVGSGAALGS